MVEMMIMGIGNPLRGDDGAGWAVIDRLEQKIPAEIHLCKQKGDIAELTDVFAHHSIVYLVDACCIDAPAGSWQRIDGIMQPLPIESNQTSTHGFNVSQAVALAKNLGLLPSKLIIYAIAGLNFNMCEMLSPPVAEAIEKVALAILNEEDIHNLCMKKV